MLGINLTTAYLLKGKGAILTVGGNTVAGAINSYVTDQPVFDGAISICIGSAIGYGMGKAIKVRLDKKINLDRSWAKYNSQPLNDKVPYVDVYRRNIVPDVSGSVIGESINRASQYYYGKIQKGNK